MSILNLRTLSLVVCCNKPLKNVQLNSSHAVAAICGHTSSNAISTNVIIASALKH